MVDTNDDGTENDKDEEIFPTPNIFCHFALGLEEGGVYADTDFEKLTELLDEGLKEYNENFAVMDLVLFEDAMKHVCRISRIIQNGHALLVVNPAALISYKVIPFHNHPNAGDPVAQHEQEQDQVENAC